ncbi:MAG: hypothetical protein PHT60_06015 [Acidiphilium sp.]|nr:hypothetical protein [Acidiphilium sp.]MDD4935319.1 hypothetical protein [Acidiphilium sp.]
MATGAIVIGASGLAWADGGMMGGSGTIASGEATSGASDQGGAASNTQVPSAGGLSDLGGAPPFGTAVRLGDAGAILNPSSGAATGLGQAPFLNIVPSIGVSEQFVTGSYGDNGQGGHEFVTSINPALLINGATPRANFTLNYNPSIQFYSNQSQNNGVNQSLNASIDATLLPQSVTVEARAYATEQATSGGLPPGGTSIYNNNNTTLTQSYSITPQFNDVFRLGTLDLQYSAQYTQQSGNAAFLPNAASPYFQTGDVFAQTEAGSFTTVPFFERFDDTPSFSATEDVGTGVLSGAHQYFVKNTLRYALMPHVVLSGSGGYEDIAYSGIPPTLIRDATWSVGVRVKFPEDGLLVARFQHLYGFNSPYVRFEYALTARTTLAASYSETLSTQQQGIGLGVASSRVNSIGLPIGGISGQPVLLANQSLSVQSGLTRNKQLSAALTTQFTRDTVSLSFQAYQDTLVATAPGLVGFSQKSASLSISESHQLSPRTNAVFYLNYGRTQSPALGVSTTSTYGTSAAVTYRVSPTLYANAQYSLTNQAYTGFGNQGVQNIFTVGIQKTF